MLGKVLLRRIFYNGLRLLIKFWIDEVGHKQFTCKRLVRAANKAKLKARIYKFKNLDQSCFHDICPLKLIFNKSGKQNKKIKDVATIAI